MIVLIKKYQRVSLISYFFIRFFLRDVGGIVVHTFSPSSEEAEVGRSVGV